MISDPTSGWKPRRFNNTRYGKRGWTLGPAHHPASEVNKCIGSVLRGSSDPTTQMGAAQARCAHLRQRGGRGRRSRALEMA